MEWPIYYKSKLTIGNPESSTGLCTLWGEKEKILKHISPKNYHIAGQCYNNKKGISAMVMHCLANKKIKNIVLCGANLNHTAEALINLKEKGVDDIKRIYGIQNARIHTDIPIAAINAFRENVNIIDKRDIKDYSSLDQFLSGIQNAAPWGESEVYPLTIADVETYPSEKTGLVVREKTVGDAWLKIIDLILKYGHEKPSQQDDDQKEIVNLTSIITEENAHNINWKPYFQFTKQDLEDYLPSIMTEKSVEDVSYNYGARMRDFKGINQIDSIVNQLSKAFFSRRAVAVLWDVEKDYNNSHSPCLNLIQCLGQEKMHMTAYIRSNDMFGAWPMNALALRNVQYEIAEKINKPIGDLVIISNSAHIYASDWDDAVKLIKEYSPKITKIPDPRGNIVLYLDNQKIKIEHFSPDGDMLREFCADSAKEAYTKIAETQIISQISHALDIGVELGKAEYALKNNLKYVQDKPLDIKKI